MKNYGLELHDEIGSAEAAAIQAGIKDFNRAYRTMEYRELTVFSRDATGHVDAGLNGYTDWGWLFVKLLWVCEPLRGRGMGARLLEAAEEEARVRGCHSAWLDTFSFQAPDFYCKQGYEVFGELANCPKGGSRWFLRKNL